MIDVLDPGLYKPLLQCRHAMARSTVVFLGTCVSLDGCRWLCSKLGRYKAAQFLQQL